MRLVHAMRNLGEIKILSLTLSPYLLFVTTLLVGLVSFASLGILVFTLLVLK
jgi:hypothetical protein